MITMKIQQGKLHATFINDTWAVGIIRPATTNEKQLLGQ